MEITGNKLSFRERNLLLVFLVSRITGEERHRVVLNFRDPAVTEGSLVCILAKITQNLKNIWIRGRIGQIRAENRSVDAGTTGSIEISVSVGGVE